MSYAFAFNAVGFFGASQFVAVLGKKYEAYVVMRRAIIGFCLMAFSTFKCDAVGRGQPLCDDGRAFSHIRMFGVSFAHSDGVSS